MNRHAWSAASLVLVLAAVAWGQGRTPALGPQVATVEVLDVGQGDAILIRSPEGKTALVDAGPAKNVVDRLRSRGVGSIDLMVISHHHADHYGAADDVLRAFPVRVFLASSSGHTTPTYLRLLELVRDRGIQAIGPTAAPRKITLGSVELTILPQPPEDTEEENNNSIGLRVRHGVVSWLLTGDSEEPERAWWMANCPELLADATVLKLAHHGSRNGTNAAWLDLVRPKLAVASLGKANGFGHPHAQPLALLQRRGVPLLRTDEVGTIAVRSDGTRWEVAAERPATRGPTSPTADRAAANRVNLNTATQAELEALPAVGPALARRIIEGRPYRSIEDLGRVRGIGPATMAKLRPLVAAE
jgi:competence protein ComEC